MCEKLAASLGFAGEITPYRNHDFRLRLTGRAFGNGSVFVCERTPCTYRRSDRHCLGDQSKSFALILQLKGSCTWEQYGRQATLMPGDCCLVNAAAPLSAVCRNDIQIGVLVYPREVAARWLPDTGAACAIPFSQSTPWGKTLAAAMTALALDSSSNLPMPEDVVIEQTNCLLTLAANPTPPQGGTYRESLLQRLRQIMRQHAADPAFGPTVCAELCGISLRTLHMTFASRKTTFCRELREIRLKLARRYLDDPKFDRKTIAEVAGLCGYAHTSHFITSFGKAVGISPRKYRTTMRQ